MCCVCVYAHTNILHVEYSDVNPDETPGETERSSDVL